ncbi:glycosyl transferase family 2 [Solidesulfovibrio fructosivorans JJ]]|uniref:Glycosyl transferase family 2 n=1 Tax=Solidesulfovibrio fructosivorans JJ] TaxID=596151 RepID=E1JSH0_SOLFR|nr:glycosyltransferase family A protein [Solidesulfovibrio fructosivorans]EFL52939.1 glycosyl transferase family 2 [Solidesulfovibrio fructosivorans JJ]]
MDTVDVSLVTYTYNDGRFVDGLLAALASWTLLPREVVVVDDGSATPYAPPPCPVPVTLLRHETNRGIPATKHEGISAGSSTSLLAMDCDTRVVPTWLETCLPLAGREDIGLVSGPVAYLSGDDLVSRYQRAFGDNHNLEKDGVTDFAPGNVFLLRRAVWEACGGMAGFGGEVCEDHFLCGRIKALGLSLWVDRRARARQTRRITRLAMSQRYWKWCREPVVRRALTCEDLPGYILAVLGLPHAERVETCITLEEPMFLYLEALYVSYTVLDVLDAAIAAGKADAALKAAWWAGLAALFAGYGTLWAVLRADLTRLGQPPRPGFPAGADNPFAPSLAALDALKTSSVFAWMAKQGVPAMLAEERAGTFDFSFYDATAGGGR